MSESNAREKFLKSIQELSEPFDESKWQKRGSENYFSANEEIFRGKPTKKQGKITDIKDYLGVFDTDYRRKPQIRRPHVKKKKTRFKGKIVALLLSGIIAIGGVAIGTSACTNINIGNKPIDTKQAVYVLGETPQSLGIKNEKYNEIQNLNNLLENGNLSDDQIIQMAPRIKDLCIDIITGKLANALGVSDKSIHLEHRYAEEGRAVQTVTVDSNHVTTSYRRKDFLTFNNSISDEIATSIKNIDRMNKIMGRIQNGDYKIGSLLSEYKDIINNIDEFAASKVKIDDKENIYVETIRNKDIDYILKAKGYIQETKQEIEKKFKTSNIVYTVDDGEKLNPINPNIEQIQKKIKEKYYNYENTNGENTNGEYDYYDER